MSVAREEFQTRYLALGQPTDIANEVMTNITSPDKRGAGGILPSAFHKKTLISSTLGNEKAPVSNASLDTESDSQYDKETENILPRLHQARSTTDSPQANLRHSAMPLQVQVPIMLKNVQHGAQETPPRAHTSTFGSLSPVMPSPEEKAKKGCQKTQVTVTNATRSLCSHNTQRLT